VTRLGGDRGDLDRRGAVAMGGSPITAAPRSTAALVLDVAERRDLDAVIVSSKQHYRSASVPLEVDIGIADNWADA